jgi:hypothetical protein
MVSLAVLTRTSAAHAAETMGPPPVNAAAMSGLMTVLDVLGIVEKDAPKEDPFVQAPVRKPTWLAPEPPKTPLLYSSLVVMKF